MGIVSTPWRTALLGAFILIAGILTHSASLYAQETQPGDACTGAETDFRSAVGGPENPGAGTLLVCDGVTWNLVYEYDNDANVGIKQSSPKAPLHVGGEAIIGNTGLVCDSVRAGGLRWSSSDNTMEMCNGFNWEKIVAALPTINLVLSPNTKNNMDVDGSCGFATCTGTTIDFTLQNQGTLTSATISVSLTNTTSFTKISDTCNGVALAPNQTCVIQVQPKATGNLAYSGRLDITANNNPFAVLQGTSTNFGCVPGRAGGGGIYAYCGLSSPEGPYDLVVTPGGCTASTINPTCAGGPDTLVLSWGVTGQNTSIIPYTDSIGAQATVDTMAIYISGAITVAPTAIQQCSDLQYAGKTDWYLPAFLEFHNYVRPNYVAIGGFNANWYWSSSHVTGTSEAWAYNFSGVTWQNLNRGDSRNIRCARRENVALPPVTPDVDPDDVDFGTTVVTTPSARASSRIITMTGFLQPVTVTVTSATGNPKVKINGGAEVSSGTLTLTNQTIQLLMDAPAVSGNKNTMTLTIGPDSYTWYAGYTDGSATGYVFVTSQTWNGSLGGLGGADAKCQAAASASGRSGTWKAIMSDTGTNAQDRIPFNWGTLRLLDNTLVANNWDDLWDGTLQNPISLSETLGTVTGYVHSGTSLYGVRRSRTAGMCSGWASNGINDDTIGSAGSAGSDWISYGGIGYSCNSLRAHYCISANVTDTTPDAFTFTDQSNVAPATQFESNIVQITGITAPSPVYVSGTWAPEYQICSNGTCSSVISGWSSTGGTTISNNQYLQIRQYSNGAGGGISDAAINVGLGTDTWSLTTIAGDPCAGSPTPGAVCSDGTVYGGTSPAGGNFYFTRCDAGQTWSGTSCTGARSTITWNAGNDIGTNTDISLINCGAAPGCDPNGETNTVIATLSDANWGVGGTQPHAAAQYCADLTIHGSSDWYLPSAPELNVGYTNKFTIGGFITSGSYYFTSSEFDYYRAWMQRFNDGTQDVSGRKYYSYHVRCARRNTDITPAALSFTDGTGATAASVVNSNILQITGIASSAQIYILGGSNAEYRVCADATCATVLTGWSSNSAGSISNNQYLQLRQTASGEGGATVNATIVVGDINDIWSVTTTAGDPCAGTPLPGSVCSDGTVYAGTSPAGGAMYATRCDYGMTWSGTACTGSRSGRTWNDGNGYWVDTALVNCGSAPGCNPDGEANTTTLIATDSNNVDVGQQLHVAAQVCSDLSMHGQTDWYMPSAPELDVMYQNRTAMGNFDLSGSWYWSSSENSNVYGWPERFSDGLFSAAQYGKNAGLIIRCVRR